MGKILVVEDDLDINKLIQKILVKEEQDVVCEFSGTEAKLRLSLEDYDVILCDLMIPGISGEELIQSVRSKDNIPMIALTAKLTVDDKVKVLELGADDYITKPFEPRELVARVNVQIRRGKLLRGGSIKEVRTVDEGEGTSLTFREISLYIESREVKVLMSLNEKG